jgi:hypothetical protein
VAYPLDQPVRLTFRTYSDSAQTVPADPTTVSVQVRDAAGVETTFTWAASQVVKDSTGVFHYDYTPAAAGHYDFHWKATGTVATALDGGFDVEAKYADIAVSVNDLLTLTEAKSAVNTTTTAGSQYDAELRALIAAVSQRLDEMLGPVVQRTVTETHDGGQSWITPASTPVFSVTSLTEYSNTTAQVLAAETNTTKTAYDYLLDSDGRHGVWIRRRSTNSDACFPVGRRNVSLVYVAGRYANTATVGSRFKEAAAITLAHLWRSEQGFAGFTSGPDEFGNQILGVPWAIPRRAIQLVQEDVRRAWVG